MANWLEDYEYDRHLAEEDSDSCDDSMMLLSGYDEPGDEDDWYDEEEWEYETDDEGNICYPGEGWYDTDSQEYN